MSEAVYGTFAKHRRDHLRKKRLQELRGGPSAVGEGSGVAARKRFLQRRLIAEVDEQNALIAEIAKHAGPRDETSELEEMAERAQRGLAATFEFKPRKAFPKLLMARIRNSRPKARAQAAGGPGPGAYYAAEAVGATSTARARRDYVFGKEQRFDDELGARGRAQRAARQRVTSEDTRAVRSSMGAQASSAQPSAPRHRFERGPRMARGGGGGAAAHVDFNGQGSCLGAQHESQKANPPEISFPPLPRRNFFASDAAGTPGPGQYLAGTDEDLAGVKPHAACARVLGRVWDQERESTQDAVADAVVGPGSYDVVPAVGVLQRESYRKNAGAASFSGHVVVQD